MSKKKISAVKAKAIVRMKELGFTVAKISELLRVSRVTVYDHTDPEYYKSRLKRSTNYKRVLTTTTEGKPVTSKKGYPERCELCKIADRRLRYHAIGEEGPLPALGLWLCNRCLTLCSMIDTLGASGVSRLIYGYGRLISKVSELKAKAESEAL